MDTNERQEIVNRLAALSMHCSATADQAKDLHKLMKKGQISRTQAIQQVEALSKHMNELRKLINTVAADLASKPAEPNLKIVKKPTEK